MIGVELPKITLHLFSLQVTIMFRVCVVPFLLRFPLHVANLFFKDMWFNLIIQPRLPALSLTETDELNWNCELSDWFWSCTELS